MTRNTGQSTRPEPNDSPADGADTASRIRRRRRIAVDVLAEEATPVDLVPLAERVGHRARRRPPLAGEVERVARQLHHRDLPKFDDAGVFVSEWPQNSLAGVVGRKNRRRG